MLKSISRVPGMHDRLPDAEERFQQLIASVLRVFSSAGYRPISVPVLEPAELFMLKSGEEIVSRLYSFDFRNQRLCVRPEITASVIRAYIEHMSDRPGPVRLCYWGPVFRYEPLEVAKYRQFNQVGVELVGVNGPGADAEVIQLALDALEAVGLPVSRVVLGHVGIASAYLRSLPLEERLRTVLLWHIEQLRYLGKEKVAETITTLSGLKVHSHPRWPMEAWPEAEVRKLLAWLIDELDIDLTGSNRSPDDIVTRLVGRLMRPAQLPVVEGAIEFLSQLASVTGSPEEAIPTVRQLLKESGVDTGPVDQLEQAANLVEFPSGTQVAIDFAMSRGLHYYTGLVFELFSDGAELVRVGGGGRYDGLVGILGGDPTTPACGFALHAERILELLGARLIEAAPQRKLAVVPLEGTAMPAALKLARKARKLLPDAQVSLIHQWGDAGLSAAFEQGCSVALLVDASIGKAGGLVLCREDGLRQPVGSIEEVVMHWEGSTP